MVSIPLLVAEAYLKAARPGNRTAGRKSRYRNGATAYDRRRMSAALLLATLLAEAPAAVAPPPREIAPGVELLPGAMLPERGPDGNTVVFDAPEGLVVVDTGRHAWHSDAILAFAKSRGRPVAAIVNTHWHLDHSSGNGRLRAAYPDAPVYATSAVDRALGEGGFLSRNLESAKPMLDDPERGDVEKDEIRIFVATMAGRDALRPQVVVSDPGKTPIAGKDFDVRLTHGAVTDADLWLYDAASGVAVLGDLVTFPAPFFETACPADWRRALDEVRSVPFRVAIPGHGEPMNPAQFDRWRHAFGAFMDCVEGTAEAGQCATGWADGIASFTAGDDQTGRAARAYAEYYAGFLRATGGKSADCLAR
jgi:glyoxylase-like metal-dependent hydrolase (beta-lactamase superfamily II)